MANSGMKMEVFLGITYFPPSTTSCPHLAHRPARHWEHAHGLLETHTEFRLVQLSHPSCHVHVSLCNPCPVTSPNHMPGGHRSWLSST